MEVVVRGRAIALMGAAGLLVAGAATGGWYDAGDYLKFTHTTAYGDIVLYAAERALGGASPSTLDSEAHFGTKWLSQMWDQRTKTSLYAMADLNPGQLVTALPYAFYPEDTWRDDMELGATELALAAQALHKNATPYLTDAANFAKGYIASDGGDTFNLYDTSALAHADLTKALAAAGNPSVAVTKAQLVADLKHQVQTGATRAATDIFHAGGVYGDFDVDSHTFGLLATQALYKQASGDASFDGFATQQRNWLFGANAWGASFMVGEGTSYPKCMQHQISNIAHSSAVGADQ